MTGDFDALKFRVSQKGAGIFSQAWEQVSDKMMWERSVVKRNEDER